LASREDRRQEDVMWTAETEDQPEGANFASSSSDRMFCDCSRERGWGRSTALKHEFEQNIHRLLQGTF